MKATSSIRTNGMRQRNKIPKKYLKNFYDDVIQGEPVDPDEWQKHTIGDSEAYGIIFVCFIVFVSAVYGVGTAAVKLYHLIWG